jgi:7-carboxy-7-deazaguanine synthase
MHSDHEPNPGGDGPSPFLVINEIYLSLQGESTFAGLPCVFVRLTGCDLRCSYCDTAYAFSEGAKMSVAKVQERVKELARPFNTTKALYRLPLVELTGGEPLLQQNSIPLMYSLCEDGFTVLIETSGAHDISAIDPRVRRIVDLKCPSSGEVGRNRWQNIAELKNSDEVKFVIATLEDYLWAKEQLIKFDLPARCPVLFSWAAPLAQAQQHKSLKPAPAPQSVISRLNLVERIIADALPVRFQVQMHKVIWAPEARGV